MLQGGRARMCAAGETGTGEVVSAFVFCSEGKERLQRIARGVHLTLMLMLLQRKTKMPFLM